MKNENSEVCAWRIYDVLDAWDSLRTFGSYERTPKRVSALRRAWEIEGNIDVWLENKDSSLIEEYSRLTGISFEVAQEKLMERPVVPPKDKQWTDNHR